MKAISLWQPYASLWLSPLKQHETRYWGTQHRGWVAVHAAKRAPPNVDKTVDLIVKAQFGRNWRRELPRGALIGMVGITDCLRTEDVYDSQHPSSDYICGDFSPGRFAWRRATYQVFQCPIPYIGRQSFFDVPDKLIEDALT